MINFKKTNRCLSLDFGQAFIKIADIEVREKDFTLFNYDFKKIISAADRQSEIAAFIHNFLKANPLSPKKTYLSISDPDSVVIKHFILPAVPKEEMRGAIKWQLKDEAPFSLEHALLDWEVVKEFTDETGAKKSQVTCILAQPEIVAQYLSIVSDCGLVPVRISSSPFNYAPILSSLQDKQATLAILDLGYQEAVLCIYKNNKLNFTRNLGFSSDKLTQSLTGVLVSDKGKIELTYEKAEEIKNTFGIPADEACILKDNIPAMHVISLMRPFLEGLAREIKRSFDYFTANFKEETPSILYLTAGGAGLKNLDSYLSKELQVRVSVLPLPASLQAPKIEKEKLAREQNQLSGVLGAALAGATGINLLPPEIKTQKIEFIQRVSLRMVAIALGAILLFSEFIFNFQIGDYRKRLKNAQAHLETIREVKLVKEKLDLFTGLIDKIESDRSHPYGLFKLLSAIIPENVVLEDLELEVAAHKLNLKGVISTGASAPEAALAAFANKLEASAFFSEAIIANSKNIGGGAHEFEIRCDLAH